jgi:dihydrodipicolinate synthase/N-acetylneuraminate lyase
MRNFVGAYAGQIYSTDSQAKRDTLQNARDLAREAKSPALVYECPTSVGYSLVVDFQRESSKEARVVAVVFDGGKSVDFCDSLTLSETREWEPLVTRV